MSVTLTPGQVESVREIVGGKSFSTISSLLNELQDAQREATIEDIVLWETDKNKRSVKLAGGPSGINFDKVPALRAIRARVCDRLGLPVPPSGGLFQIHVGHTYSDACDV